ncbi:antitoxin VbhA family protein [Leucobacter tenebrionis]|uniref:antitoxin VbhA family protein n=1 Tax=Leucobacter tenebrionis TaxID=2873270 RepID=UPI001CA5F8A6|nr:antitoxin VbhA family protein [Leucobacter tenebrionis]QZY52255.1 antitoxin VbhA family protein [Leucobacter tenebrionis]
MLTKEQRRELAIDTMASWALEGMEPSPEAVGRISAFVEGDLSLDEFIAEAKAAAA